MANNIDTNHRHFLFFFFCKDENLLICRCKGFKESHLIENIFVGLKMMTFHISFDNSLFGFPLHTMSLASLASSLNLSGSFIQFVASFERNCSRNTCSWNTYLVLRTNAKCSSFLRVFPICWWHCKKKILENRLHLSPFATKIMMWFCITLHCKQNVE